MLSFYDDSKRHGRRQFLRVGGLGLGGLSLSQFFGASTQAAATSRLVTDKSVIFLFMHGGPSQTETFDPKMTAPSGIRSQTGEVATCIPGVTFGGTFTKLASMADKLAIVRSFVTGDGNHDIKPIVGRDTFNANLGSIYARVAGITNSNTGLPTNVALFPRAVDAKAQAANMNFGKFASSGTLGKAYEPFVPGGGDLWNDMQLSLPIRRIDDRRSILRLLDAARWNRDRLGGEEAIDRVRQQAFDTILDGVVEAFDLTQEESKTVERYDTAPLVRPDQISRQWNNYNNYVDNARSLGKLLLLARRLCQRGCGFVTVTTNFVWDMHADQNNAGVEEGMRYMGLPFDHAVSTFIDDVHACGLSDKILLVCCGEMGRTPRVNKNGGRDHWGKLAPLLIAGGGLNMGQVVGQSTRDVGAAASDPVDIRNLIATVLHTMLDVSQLRLDESVPSNIIQAANDWKPITSLF